MFRRVTNFDLLTRMIEIENKIDILNSKLSQESITFQGCCDCNVKELTIYKEIKDYFETKYDDIVNRLKDIEDNYDKDKLNNILQDYKKEMLRSFENVISNLEMIKDEKYIDKDNYNQKIKDIYQLLTEHIRNSNFQGDLQTDVNKYFIEINNKIDQLKQFEEKIKEHNKSQMNMFIEHVNNLFSLTRSSEINSNIIKIDKLLEDVNKRIIDVYSKLNEMYTKIDLLYYENETIKHQFLLEEDIRKYEYEINTLSNTIKKTVQEIDNLIKHYEM